MISFELKEVNELPNYQELIKSDIDQALYH